MKKARAAIHSMARSFVATVPPVSGLWGPGLCDVSSPDFSGSFFGFPTLRGDHLISRLDVLCETPPLAKTSFLRPTLRGPDSGHRSNRFDTFSSSHVKLWHKSFLHDLAITPSSPNSSEYPKTSTPIHQLASG